MKRAACSSLLLSAILSLLPDGLPASAQTAPISEPAATQARIAVSRFVFEGNRALTEKELAVVLQPFTGREITADELEGARAKLAKHYAASGYSEAAVTLPDQDPAEGVIKFAIIEGPRTAPALPETPDQLAPLPSDPGKALGIDEMTLLPGEMLLQPAPLANPLDLPGARRRFAEQSIRPVLPPLPAALPNTPTLAASSPVSVKRFRFEGNRVFSDRKLGSLIAAYAGRKVSLEELEAARVILTKHYIDAGYINSGAVLPDQNPKSGEILFQIVEGRLTGIELHGNRWFRSWWLQHQFRRAAGNPVNFNQLKTGLQFLRQNPTISRINAELKPGDKPGEAVLHATVKDEQPFRLGFEINNQRPPSVGEGIGEISLSNWNLTGHNDPLDLRWGIARWTKDGSVEYADFDNARGSYEFPISPWDTTLRIAASKSDSSIIDETFAELGIASKSTDLSFTLLQPVLKSQTNREVRSHAPDGSERITYRAHSDTLTLSLSADRRHSASFLLDRPFSLSPGAIDGESDVFALRFAMEWVNRSQAHVFAARSVFSWGLYAFGSTRALEPTGGVSDETGLGNEIPDSKFFSWLGQAQYVRRIFTNGLPLPPEAEDKPRNFGERLRQALGESMLVARANAQFSDEPLLSLEQFSLGGMQSVRGYRENQLLRDNGVFASAELRVPLWLDKEKVPVVSLAPFFDFGTGWNTTDRPNDQSQTIYSAGAGLLINASRHAQVAVYWGHPFVKLQDDKTSLQDYGWHFSVNLNAF